MSEDIEREIQASLRRVRAAQEQRDQIKANRAQVQADVRWFRIIIAVLILLWIAAIALVWRYS